MKVLTSFLGVDKTVAQTQIVSEGFTVGTVTQSDSSDSAEGPNHNKVIIQSPVSSSLIDYDSPISITWRNFSFTPYSFTPYSFTPGPYSFTPFSFTPYSFTPYSFTPYSFTPYSFTPAPAEKYFSYAYCQNGSPNGYTAMAISTGGWSTVAEACSAIQASLAPYGISNWKCEEGTNTGPNFVAQYTTNNTCAVAPPPTGGTIPNVVGLGLSLALGIISDEGFINAPTQGNSGVGATAQNHQKVKSQNPAAGTTAPFSTNVQLVLYYFNPDAYSFTPYSFTPGPYSFTPYSFTPYSFTPYSFTPGPYSFTPYSFTPGGGFTGCRGAKPYPYCVCQSDTPGTNWVC
jgi:hypothetical protein